MVIQQYRDPKINKYLGWGYWYHEHKEQITRAVTILILVLAALVWIIFFFNAYQYFAGGDQNKLIVETIARKEIDYQQIHSRQMPRPLERGSVSVLPKTESAADFVVRATNPNTSWLLTLDYQFTWAQGETTVKSARLLPEQTMILNAQEVSLNSLPLQVNLEIGNINWQRIKNTIALNFVSEIRQDLEYSEVEIDTQEGFTSAKYSLKNKSLYTILEPRFLLILTDFAGRIVGFGINQTAAIKADEESRFESRWPETFASTLTAEIFPLIDFFDSQIYKLETGEGIKF